MPRQKPTNKLFETALADDSERVETFSPPFAKPASTTDAAPPAPVAVTPLHRDIPAATGAVEQHSSAEWRDTLIPAIQAKLDDADVRLEAAANGCGAAELSLALGHDGAEEVAGEAREAQRLIAIERDGLLRALKRAEIELADAEKREGAVERAQRMERARHLAQERVNLAFEFDELMAQIGEVCDRLESSARNLSNYADLTRVAHHRLQLASAYQQAIFRRAPSFARALDLGRDKPLVRMQDLSLTFAQSLSMFANVTIPKSVATASAATVDLDSPTLGEHGGEVIDQPLVTGGETFAVGTILAAELVATWPVKNRRALARLNRIRWFAEPQAPAADADSVDTLLS